MAQIRKKRIDQQTSNFEDNIALLGLENVNESCAFHKWLMQTLHASSVRKYQRSMSGRFVNQTKTNGVQAQNRKMRVNNLRLGIRWLIESFDRDFSRSIFFLLIYF
jgi:hypothetical protein